VDIAVQKQAEQEILHQYHHLKEMQGVTEYLVLRIFKVVEEVEQVELEVMLEILLDQVEQV
jgi:hypothetical protein